MGRLIRELTSEHSDSRPTFLREALAEESEHVPKEPRNCIVCGDAFDVWSCNIRAYPQGGRFCSLKCKRIGLRKTLPDRFWSKVDKEGPSPINKSLGPCWLWTGAKLTNGYGRLQHEGRGYSAHRIAYELQIGVIPDGLWVCHHCDTPACVNGSHLFLGTPLDNARDMSAKGRRRWYPTPPERRQRGGRHYIARFTESQVVEMRRVHAAGLLNTYRLAKLLDVPYETVRSIIRRETWAHIPESVSS